MGRVPPSIRPRGWLQPSVLFCFVSFPDRCPLAIFSSRTVAHTLIVAPNASDYQRDKHDKGFNLINPQNHSTKALYHCSRFLIKKYCPSFPFSPLAGNAPSRTQGNMERHTNDDDGASCCRYRKSRKVGHRRQLLGMGQNNQFALHLTTPLNRLLLPGRRGCIGLRCPRPRQPTLQQVRQCCSRVSARPSALLNYLRYND